MIHLNTEKVLTPFVDYFEDCKVNDKITNLAKSMLLVCEKVGYHAPLIAAKAIAIPFEIAIIAFVTAAVALSALLSLPVRVVLDSKESVRTFHTLLATLYDLGELLRITLDYGLYPESERLQRADNDPDSPEYVCITPSTESDAAPIIYGPGYLDTPDSLRSTCRRLAERTHRRIYIVKHRSLFQSIVEHTKDYDRVRRRAAVDTLRSDFVAIGHSMGGLVTGRCIQLLPPDQGKALCWITVGSPLQGDPLACLAIGTCAKEMTPDSDLIKRLNTPGRLNEIPALHIHSLTDNVVPHEYSMWPNSRNCRTYQCKEGYGHLSMRSCAEVENEEINTIQEFAL